MVYRDTSRGLLVSPLIPRCTGDAQNLLCSKRTVTADLNKRNGRVKKGMHCARVCSLTRSGRVQLTILVSLVGAEVYTVRFGSLPLHTPKTCASLALHVLSF